MPRVYGAYDMYVLVLVYDVLRPSVLIVIGYRHAISYSAFQRPLEMSHTDHILLVSHIVRRLAHFKGYLKCAT